MMDGMLMGFNPGFLLIMVVSMALGGITQWYIKATFSRFSQVPTSTGLTGAQVANHILQTNGIAADSSASTNRQSVATVPVKGSLTDHYDPRKGLVALSEPVYGVNSLSATAVAAHEVGHALQTSQRYFWGEFRTAFVPVVNFGSQAAGMLIMMGFIINLTSLLWVGIACYSAAVIFQVITLPVELNASRRALAQLKDNGLLTQGELPGARKVLTAAALTYVAAALISLIYLLHYISLAKRR